jgi:rhodanese-related sulfurtransferase
MERLIDYVTHHPLMAGAVVLALVIVVTFESRLRGVAQSAISAQDLIRLMNQGALVLDIRKPDEFAAGHVSGAKQLPSDQILTAGDTFKRFKDKPVVVYCDSGSLGAAAVRQLVHQGFTKAFTLRGGFTGWRAENLPVAKGA